MVLAIVFLVGIGVILGILLATRVAPLPAISAPPIGVGEVTTEKIADGAVTVAKLSPEVSGRLLAPGGVTSAHIADATIVDADVASNAGIAWGEAGGLSKRFSGHRTDRRREPKWQRHACY